MQSKLQPNLTDRIGWWNPKLEKREAFEKGLGLFAIQPIAEDEVLAVWGGYVVTGQQRRELPIEIQHYTLQIEDDLHLTNGLITDDADYINHSCDPNAGLRGQIVLVAMRSIAVGEEICFDYAMSEGDPKFFMQCAGGHEHCRKVVTGNDWKLADLQARYKGYFSPYIARLIRLQNGG